MLSHTRSLTCSRRVERGWKRGNERCCCGDGGGGGGDDTEEPSSKERDSECNAAAAAHSDDVCLCGKRCAVAARDGHGRLVPDIFALTPFKRRGRERENGVRCAPVGLSSTSTQGVEAREQVSK